MSQKRGIKYEEEMELRRGPWTLEEDSLLIHYIARHGEGRWNLLAKFSGLKRTGKSCRLRWLNYLKPDVRRGNLSPEEQYLILELHSKWGNRWSRIAQQLPGRTDNEIKNYWRTRVQRQARQLKIDANSSIFRDAVRRYWMPRLLQKIDSSATLQSFDNRNTVAIPTIVTTDNSSVTNNFEQATNAPPLPLPLPPPPPSKSFDPGIQQAFDNSAYYEPSGSENWNLKFSGFSSSPSDDFVNTDLSFSRLLDGQINVGHTYNADVVELASTSASTSDCKSYDQNCVGGGCVENLWGLDELWHVRKLHEWSGI